MPEMSWNNAVAQVLTDAVTPMSVKDITAAIGAKGYRTLSGKTPEATVSAQLTSAKTGHRYMSPSKGLYTLAGTPKKTAPKKISPKPAAKRSLRKQTDQMGLINAFGMFWSRTEVDWRGKTPKLLGTPSNGGNATDFSNQAGVYLLYDSSGRVVYVGKVEQARLGLRLAEHTKDRLSSRWDRFSWFGVRSVKADGKLGDMPSSGISVSTLIATMEALLIEGLEPPQNRRQGDGFRAVEFLQQTDPDLADRRRRQDIQALLNGG